MNISKKDVMKIIGIFIIYKILIISIAYASYAIPEDFTRRQNISEDPTINLIFDPFAQLDSRAYIDIAKNGYNSEFGNTTNFGWYPLYPMLIILFSFAGFELAAFLISNIFSFTAVLLLYVLVREEFGEKVGKKSVTYLLFWPASFFLTVMYTESLFLTLTIAMFIFAKQGKWHYVGILGFLTALARPQGALMFIPMLYMLIVSKGDKFNLRAIRHAITHDKLNILLLLLIPTGAVTLFGYYGVVFDDPFIHFNTLTTYARGFSITGPITAFSVAIREVLTESRILDVAISGFNIAVTLLLIGLTYISYKRLKLEYTIYFVLSLLLPLFSSSLASMSRFGLMIFPVFMVLSLEAEKKRNKLLIILLYVIFIAALILGTLRYASQDILL